MADRVRVLVLGDSGVGKTVLIHLICNTPFSSGVVVGDSATQPLLNPPPTVGLSVEVKVGSSLIHLLSLRYPPYLCPLATIASNSFCIVARIPNS